MRNWKLRLILLAAGFGLLLVPLGAPAELAPGKQDKLVTELVCAFLKRAHLSQPELNEDLSKRLFRRFLKDLDPYKLYFLKSDVDELKQHESELAEKLLLGDLSFAYKVYDRFMTRLGERMKLVEELINGPHDFTVKEYLDTDFDRITYAENRTS